MYKVSTQLVRAGVSLGSSLTRDQIPAYLGLLVETNDALQYRQALKARRRHRLFWR